MITTRNVTRINETHARKDVIKHDITSGTEPLYQTPIFNNKVSAFRNFLKLVMAAAQSGDYWRLLTPGEYEITASIKNYRPLTRRVVVINPIHQEAYVVNFDLESATNQGQSRTWVN